MACDPDPRVSPITVEFSHQVDRFAAAPVMHSRATLDAFLDLVPTRPDDVFLDVACGPGIVARALVRRVKRVVGTDLTPAMLERARADARREGVTQVEFLEGDATALPFPDASFDGAITRFSLHHIPAPGRVVREMARVVRAGATVSVLDHLTSERAQAAAWHQEIERLRDPSHWACLTGSSLQSLGAAAGLERMSFKTMPFTLDFEEWVTRGSGGPAHRALIEQLASRIPPGGAAVFARSGPTGSILRLRLGISVWRRPA